MVVWSKILPIAALGVALVFIVQAFSSPAAATSTARALTDQISVLGRTGTNIREFGTGVGGGLAGLFQPVWEIANLFERFSNLSGGAANVSPVAQAGTNGGAPTWTVSGGNTQGGGMFNVGGTDIRTSTIGWESGPVTVPLSDEARKWYGDLGVSVT